ncbi:MAG: RES family NAD+ phosphorylase [Paracoccaceae bacterium]
MFYRIIFERDVKRVLDAVPSQQGRFHHDGQPAIYMSPSPQAAAVAIDSYYRENDPPRVIVPLLLSGANLLDFRAPTTSDDFGLQGHETRVNWREELRMGQQPSSWHSSDAARRVGADGMIYHSRKSPTHWHLVLFRWNRENAPQLRRDGLALPFDPGQ